MTALVVRRARAGRIVVPPSGGHMVESAALYGAKCRDLAYTVLPLSGCWRKLDPVRVRKAEFAAALADGPPGLVAGVRHRWRQAVNHLGRCRRNR